MKACNAEHLASTRTLAILLQLHPVSCQPAPAIQFLLVYYIIHVDAVLAKAVAVTKHHMLGVHVLKLDGV